MVFLYNNDWNKRGILKAAGIRFVSFRFFAIGSDRINRILGE